MSLAVRRPHFGQTSRSGACGRGRRTATGGGAVFGAALAGLRTGIDTSIPFRAVIATADADLFTEEIAGGRRSQGAAIAAIVSSIGFTASAARALAL